MATPKYKQLPDVKSTLITKSFGLYNFSGILNKPPAKFIGYRRLFDHPSSESLDYKFWMKVRV
jgi:hypothetical protein